MVFSAMLFIVTLDDILGIHEVIGAFVVQFAGIGDYGWARAQDFGELAVFAIFGLCLVPLFVWCTLTLTVADLAVFLIYGSVFGLFVFLAVGVDFIHAMVDNKILARLLGWIEDGGEIVAIALLASVVILQSRGRRFA